METLDEVIICSVSLLNKALSHTERLSLGSIYYMGERESIYHCWSGTLLLFPVGNTRRCGPDTHQ